MEPQVLSSPDLSQSDTRWSPSESSHGIRSVLSICSNRPRGLRHGSPVPWHFDRSRLPSSDLDGSTFTIVWSISDSLLAFERQSLPQSREVSGLSVFAKICFPILGIFF